MPASSMADASQSDVKHDPDEVNVRENDATLADGCKQAFSDAPGRKDSNKAVRQNSSVPDDRVVQDATFVVESIRREEFGLEPNLSYIESCMLKKQHDRLGWALHCLSQELYSQDSHLLLELVDLLVSFCLGMGFLSLVLVGHDDGCLLSLKAAEKLRPSAESVLLKVKGVVLLSVWLSTEVVPAFARILLQTSLGKKHMVRPLLHTEITQVINRRAWSDPTKLTEDVMNFYKEKMVNRMSESTIEGEILFRRMRYLTRLLAQD